MFVYQALRPLFGVGIVPAPQVDTIRYVAVFADDEGSIVSQVLALHGPTWTAKLAPLRGVPKPAKAGKLRRLGSMLFPSKADATGV
jgi:hypothetical protein